MVWGTNLSMEKETARIWEGSGCPRDEDAETMKLTASWKESLGEDCGLNARILWSECFFQCRVGQAQV